MNGQMQFQEVAIKIDVKIHVKMLQFSQEKLLKDTPKKRDKDVWNGNQIWINSC